MKYEKKNKKEVEPWKKSIPDYIIIEDEVVIVQPYCKTTNKKRKRKKNKRICNNTKTQTIIDNFLEIER